MKVELKNIINIQNEYIKNIEKAEEKKKSELNKNNNLFKELAEYVENDLLEICEDLDKINLFGYIDIPMKISYSNLNIPEITDDIAINLKMFATISLKKDENCSINSQKSMINIKISKNNLDIDIWNRNQKLYPNDLYKRIFIASWKDNKEKFIEDISKEITRLFESRIKYLNNENKKLIEQNNNLTKIKYDLEDNYKEYEDLELD